MGPPALLNAHWELFSCWGCPFLVTLCWEVGPSLLYPQWGCLPYFSIIYKLLLPSPTRRGSPAQRKKTNCSTQQQCFPTDYVLIADAYVHLLEYCHEVNCFYWACFIPVVVGAPHPNHLISHSSLTGSNLSIKLNIFHSCYLMLYYVCAVPVKYRINHLSYSFRVRYCMTFLSL